MEFITLKGARVPALGFGTWTLSGESGRRTIAEAIAVGYRHIDTAQMYGNEAEVGAAIKASNIGRDEFFVTTKLSNGNHAATEVRRSTEESLRALGIGVIDLLLIHWPGRGGQLRETLDAMAQLRAQGKVRYLGVSNFTAALIAEAVERCGADLLCNQVEYHPFLTQRAVLASLAKHRMMLTAYAPVARGRVLRDPTIAAIARRHGKTPGQVALRWLLDQPNVAAIPKASSRAHMVENISIFDFELSAADTEALDALGGNGRIVDFAGWSPRWDQH